MSWKRTMIFVLAGSCLLLACDKIEPPYMKTPQGGNGDTEVLLKKILLEDYTGHTCVNCPAAAKTASDLQQLYPDQLVIMAVHSGHFAKPQGDPFLADYRTEVGEAWEGFFGTAIKPNGVINRRSNNGNYVVSPGNWPAEVTALLNDPAEIQFEITPEYNTTNRKLDIAVKGEFLTALTGEYKLIVCILEDSIVSPQKNSDASAGVTPIIHDYVHRHMLRQTVNGIWGESIAVQPIANSMFETQYSLTLNSQYKAQHCSIMAFVYDAANWEIMQVEEVVME
ncbi:MAG: Omp28 family outer membrane lipoprotein [Bacteroidales bacterium]|nr:Omp28 family outer membrane lipoprotein [Bacteroidales bacterium]MDY0368848.1 Omp28 family outer membrane lipoprotein [Bacteroidales bacterium]